MLINLCIIQFSNFIYLFPDKQPVSCIKHTDPIYCLELPQLKEASSDAGEYLLLCWINVLTFEDQCVRYVPEDVTVNSETDFAKYTTY